MQLKETAEIYFAWKENPKRRIEEIYKASQFVFI